MIFPPLYPTNIKERNFRFLTPFQSIFLMSPNVALVDIIIFFLLVFWCFKWDTVGS